MKFRKWLDQNSAAVTVVTLIFMIGALISIYYQLSPPRRRVASPNAFYYDLNSTKAKVMDRLFVSNGNQFPPIPAPSGKPMDNGLPSGVRAWVFSCGSCTDKSKYFIGFLETFTQEGKEAIQALKNRTPSMIEALEASPEGTIVQSEGHLISTPGEDAWVTFGSQAGAEIMSKIQQHCTEPDKPAIPCGPDSP